MPTRRTAGAERIGDLSPEMVNLLIGHGKWNPFMELHVTEEQVEAAWRLYGGALRAEAQRRGVELPATRRA